MTLTLARAFWITAALALLGGCSYDYLQHSDRIGYATGDAVKANLEGETTTPDSGAAYNTGGLGQDGAQFSVELSSAAP